MVIKMDKADRYWNNSAYEMMFILISIVILNYIGYIYTSFYLEHPEYEWGLTYIGIIYIIFRIIIGANKYAHLYDDIADINNRANKKILVEQIEKLKLSRKLLQEQNERLEERKEKILNESDIDIEKDPRVICAEMIMEMHPESTREVRMKLHRKGII
jgi:hypothetical protein